MNGNTYNVCQNATIGVSSTRKKEVENRFSLAVWSTQNQAFFFRHRKGILVGLRLAQEPLNNVDTLTSEKNWWGVVQIVGFRGSKFQMKFVTKKGEIPAHVEMFLQLTRVSKQIESTVMTRNELMAHKVSLLLGRRQKSKIAHHLHLWKLNGAFLT